MLTLPRTEQQPRMPWLYYSAPKRARRNDCVPQNHLGSFSWISKAIAAFMRHCLVQSIRKELGRHWQDAERRF